MTFKLLDSIVRNGSASFAGAPRVLPGLTPMTGVAGLIGMGPFGPGNGATGGGASLPYNNSQYALIDFEPAPSASSLLCDLSITTAGSGLGSSGGVSTVVNGKTIFFGQADLGQLVNAGSFIVGNLYTIQSVGTTNWTAIGASSNTVGVSFVATGVGSGSGTAVGAQYDASPNPQAGYWSVPLKGGSGNYATAVVQVSAGAVVGIWMVPGQGVGYAVSDVLTIDVRNLGGVVGTAVAPTFTVTTVCTSWPATSTWSGSTVPTQANIQAIGTFIVNHLILPTRSLYPNAVIGSYGVPIVGTPYPSVGNGALAAFTDSFVDGNLYNVIQNLDWIGVDCYLNDPQSGGGPFFTKSCTLGTVPSSSPYTLTANFPAGGSSTQNVIGVYHANDGSTATYSSSTGNPTVTFPSSEAGKAVIIVCTGYDSNAGESNYANWQYGLTSQNPGDKPFSLGVITEAYQAQKASSGSPFQNFPPFTGTSLGKPVYAFLQPDYVSNSTGQPDNAIDQTTWSNALNYLKSGGPGGTQICDGIAIYAQSITGSPQLWSNTLPWYLTLRSVFSLEPPPTGTIDDTGTTIDSTAETIDAVSGSAAGNANENADVAAGAGAAALLGSSGNSQTVDGPGTADSSQTVDASPLTESPDAAFGSGSASTSGIGATIEAADTASGLGGPVGTGQGGDTELSDVAIGSGSTSTSGSGASVESADRAAPRASGTIDDIHSTIDSIAETIDAVAVQGSASIIESADSAAGSGSAASSAAGSATTVDADVAAGVGLTSPVITLNPSNAAAYAGGTASFTAAASGSPTPTVQWQLSTDGGATWSNISGASSTTYTTGVLSTGNSGNEYRAVFTNTAGSATSNAAALTVLSVITSGGRTMEFVFGPGTLIATPLTDAYGNTIATPTPRQLGAFQEAQFDTSAENKMLYGQNAFPLAVGRGKAKAALKVKAAQISVDKWNAMYIGQPANQHSSVVSAYIDTQGTAIPGTPYQITPVTTYSAYLQGTTPAFAYDLGVQDGAGNAYTCVASGPATGQYSLSGGVYTFAAADVGKVVFISFAYTATNSAGAKNAYVNVANTLMGYAPFLQLDLYASYGGNPFMLTLWSAIATKLSFATKLDDFAVPDIEFDGFSAASGTNAGKVFQIAAGQ